MTDGYDIERTFDAPRELVWSMWTTPEHFAYWWGGTTVDVPLDAVAMDVRVDGTWKATMVGPDDAWRMNWAGEYLEVDRPGKLVMTLTDNADAPARETFTIILTEVDGGTLMHLHQGGGNLTEEQYELTRQGTSSFMDALAERLASLP